MRRGISTPVTDGRKATESSPSRPGADAARTHEALLDGVDRPRRLREKCPARLGELDAPFRAEEELHTESRLEVANRTAERWLRDVQSGGRSAEVELLGHRHEVADFPDLDADSRKLSIGGQPVLDTPHS